MRTTSNHDIHSGTGRATLLGRLLLGGLLIAAPLCAGCLTDFSAGEPPCGDGVVALEEECDDGNSESGDGCDAECVVEEGWDCTGEPSDCETVCGDSAIHGDEACDWAELGGSSCEDLGFYGGTLACRTDCSAFDTSGCSGACGDGVLNGAEACDGTELDGQDCQSFGFYGGTLDCRSDCSGVDTASCAGECGDGVINGPEVCDGAALPNDSCTDYGAFFGGTLSCSGDCSTVDTSQCWTAPRVVINEVYLSRPDWVELQNVSEVAVELESWVLEWHSQSAAGALDTGQLVMPIYTLQPGARVVLREDSTNSGAPATVGNGFIQFGWNINWGSASGAAHLRDDSGGSKDFVRWGSAEFAVPPGAAWTDNQGFLPAPGLDNMTVSLSRVPNGVDTDVTSDWCVAAESEGAANLPPCVVVVAPGTLLISELTYEGGDVHVELYNPGNAAVQLAGWALRAAGLNYTASELPAFSLAAQDYVEIVDDATTLGPYASAGVLHIDGLGTWWGTNRYLALLAPESYAGVDFLRWGGSNAVPAAPDTWSDGTDAVPNPANGESLGRQILVDTNTGTDWCVLQSVSLGGPNGPCQ